MAQITTVALAPRDVKQYVNSFTNVSMTFSPTQLTATVTNLDRILIATLPSNAKIIGAQVRVIGTSGLTSITHLQTTEPTGNTIFLTPTSGASAAPSIALVALMNSPHSHATLGTLSTTGTRDLELVVATGSFSATNGLVVVVDAQYAFYP